ncbi:MAG: dicarboxylate/amino acid:cation symporter [Schleiferiaceae bacterium]|nr:dicarboxylate/amino acid:cation symporter [Schleiferiaceae bacterium]
MKLALHWKILIGLALGIIWALLSASLGWSQFTLDYIGPLGTIFINLLKLIAVPLVLFSIISGVAGLGDPSSLGRLGAKTLALYLGTTLLAITVGLLMVNTAAPGKRVDDQTRIENRISYELWARENGKTIKDDRRFLQDPQYEEAVARVRSRGTEEAQRQQIAAEMETAQQTKEAGPLQPLVDLVPSNIFSALSSGGSMLQVIFFALFFGICLLFIPRAKAEPVIAFVNGTMEVFLKMVDFIMRAAPVFVFALLAGQLSKMAGNNVQQVVEIFKGLGWYSLTVFLGLVLVMAVLYPLLVKWLVKGLSYTGFFKAMSPAQTLAFSTSSSAATLPVTMECVEDNLGVDKKISSFVLPIGATVNMDGTSLYQAVAVVFLAQLHFIDLTVGQQLIIVFTAALASIGSAAVPSAGLVMLIIVLESVGLNPAWIAIVLPVDRILDMCRTAVNVTGDGTVSSIIAQSEGMIKPPAQPALTTAAAPKNAN